MNFYSSISLELQTAWKFSHSMGLAFSILVLKLKQNSSNTSNVPVTQWGVFHVVKFHKLEISKNFPGLRAIIVEKVNTDCHKPCIQCMLALNDC